VKGRLAAAKEDKDPKRWAYQFCERDGHIRFNGWHDGKEVQQLDGRRPSPSDDYEVNKRLSEFFSQAPKDYAELPGDLILAIIRTNELLGGHVWQRCEESPLNICLYFVAIRS